MEKGTHGSTPLSITAPLLLQWVQRSVLLLGENRTNINQLNVFPIPDGDTGSNMHHTLLSALSAVEEVQREKKLGLIEMTQILSQGAVQGARGNSGVILSQLFHALSHHAQEQQVQSLHMQSHDAEALSTRSGYSEQQREERSQRSHGGEENLDHEFDAADVVTILLQTVDFITVALPHPVEGTLLSVLRQAARAAAKHQPASLVQTVDIAYDEAQKALRKTTTQLPALARAGVVDAGGQGLVIVLQALKDVLHVQNIAQNMPSHPVKNDADKDENPDFYPAHYQHDAADSKDVSTPTGTDHADIELMFFFTAHSDRGMNQMRELLERYGDSIVLDTLGIVDNPRRAFIHVHSAHAGTIIEKASALGRIEKLRIEALYPRTQPQLSVVHEEDKDDTLIAVIPEGEIAQLFRSAGAYTLTPEEYPLYTPRSTLIIIDNGFELPGRSFPPGLKPHIIHTPGVLGGLSAIAVYQPEYRDKTGEGEESIVNYMEEAVEEQQWCGVDRLELPSLLSSAEEESFNEKTVSEETLSADLIERIRPLIQDQSELITYLINGKIHRSIALSTIDTHIAQAFPHHEIQSYSSPRIHYDLEIGVE